MKVNKSLPRGIRNNNPLNLRLTKINWVGKVPNSQNSDKAFEQFVDVKYGFRAAAKDLVSDFKKGKTSIQLLINEFAPPHENNTNSYAANVAKYVGFNVDAIMDYGTFRGSLHKILYRMHISENGKPFYTEEQIKEYIKEV